MKCEYTSNDDNIKVLVDAINKQLKSNDADDIDALYFENESYYFGEGLRKLFILRPRFMRKILDYMLEKIHTILQGEELIETKYIDFIINEWHNNLKNGAYNVKNNAKKYEIKRSFTPKYALENDANVIIRCSDTWIPQKNFDSLELKIYINDDLIKSQSLKFYDSPNGRILVKFTVNIDDYLKCDDNILLSRLVVFADEERIFDYELNSRKVLCFKGDREIRPEDLRQGGYLFFVVNGHNLEFENTDDETDIDLPDASKWEKAVYAELDADFKVWLDDELIAYDDPSKIFSNNSNIRKNLDNLATTIETNVKNLSEVSIINDKGEQWPPKRYMWMDDINRREIITVSYPTSNPCELWVGNKKVAERKGKRFALGETAAKFSPRSENSWVDITLRRGAEIYIIGHLTKKERFIKSVVMNYEIGENVLYWNMGGGFVGNNNGEFRLVINNKSVTVYDEPLDLASEIAIPNVNFPRGYYYYKIIKRINDMWGNKELLLYDGQIIIGDEDALRFQGRRIKINKIFRYLNGKIKDEPDSIKEIYIDNLSFLGRENVEGEARDLPVYNGTMFYINNNLRFDFSGAEYFKTNEHG
ncbi:MAG: hypothetical protein IKN12_02290 [Selenomonadaceae bacterium]|nr:hypothetical protein [Selenomonadaceae bacterium]